MKIRFFIFYKKKVQCTNLYINLQDSMASKIRKVLSDVSITDYIVLTQPRIYRKESFDLGYNLSQ
jgi:hypothetical protein